MDIKDLLKLETIRVLLVYLSLYLIGRSIFFLTIDEPFAYFSSGHQQEMLHQLFDLEVPMVMLTMMWPLVLTFLTLAHNSLRLARGLFLTVIGMHTLSCLTAALMIYSWGVPNVVIDNTNEYPTLQIVTLVTALTIIISLVSLALYHKRYSLYEIS